MHITVEKCWSKGKRGNEQSLGHSSWMQTLIKSLHSKPVSVVLLWGGGEEDRVISLDKRFFKSEAYYQTLIKHSEHRRLRGSKLNTSGFKK